MDAKHRDAFVGGVEETGRAVWREVRNPIEAEVWMQETVVVNA
jgi:hypothetical protein